MSIEDRQLAQERAKQNEKERRRQELADLQSMLKLPAGRRFVWRLLEDAGILRDAFTGNSNTYYILGKQAYGRALFADVLQHYPKLYEKMQSEALTRQKKEDLTNG